MIADQDFKLIGSIIHKFLAGVHLDFPDGDTIITGALAGCQNQNGLAKIKWSHAIDMVHNWINASSILPRDVSSLLLVLI
eukprot:12459243-Ditylum_brightwellii.AAC.1